MNSYRHFPLTSARYELSEPHASIGQNFSTEIVPLGQIAVKSGRLAIGDPLLGMASGANPWVHIASGAYAVSLTRLVCLDNAGLEIPAYLSITLDPIEVEKRRQRQDEIAQLGGDPGLAMEQMATLLLSENGTLEEVDDPDDRLEPISSRSGVISMVDETAFESRMPDPLHINGGWFERYFDAQSEHSWLKHLDDEQHLGAGIANIPLPNGPDDWIEAQSPTIALVQMASPGPADVFVEYAKDDHHHAFPIAVHIELGLLSSLHGAGLQAA